MRSGSPGGDRAKERAARLREALRRRGVPKLYALALDLGVDQSTISRWTKEGGMSLDHAVALCGRLGISLDWLIFGHGPMDVEGRAAEADALADLVEAMDPELVAAFLVLARAIAGRR